MLSAFSILRRRSKQQLNKEETNVKKHFYSSSEFSVGNLNINIIFVLQNLRLLKTICRIIRVIVKNICRKFNVLLTVHHAMILGNCPTWHTFLYVLLYQIAALFLYNFVLMFLYFYVCVACFASQNLTFCWPCIMQWFLVIVQLDVRQVGQLPRIICTKTLESYSNKLKYKNNVTQEQS